MTNELIVSTSVDGRAAWSEGVAAPEGIPWAELIAKPGNYSNDTATSIRAFFITAGSDANRWWYLSRGIFLFDTSPLPSNAIIISATLSFHGWYTKRDELGALPNVNVYSSAPASVTAIADGDFDSLGTTPFATAIAYDDWVNLGWNVFTLNTAGRAAISKGGITKFGTRNANYDVAKVAPAWSPNRVSHMTVFSAEHGDGSLAPKLTITYTFRKGNPNIDQLIYQHVERMDR